MAAENKEMIYVTPEIDVFEVEVEQGFAQSQLEGPEEGGDI